MKKPYVVEYDNEFPDPCNPGPFKWYIKAYDLNDAIERFYEDMSPDGWRATSVRPEVLSGAHRDRPAK